MYDMVDLSIFDQWIQELEDVSFTPCRNDINNSSFDKWFDNEITVFFNCAHLFKDGSRCLQTNDRRYNRTLTKIIKMIQEFVENDKQDYYFKILINRHKSNLEYEAIHGFEYIINNKDKTKKTTNKKNKQLSISSINEPTKETKAASKLKKQAIKVNKLNFGFKLANNDNVI